MRGFDYIIIGSGTAGATLAARLTEDSAARVLVLEGGGADRGFWLIVLKNSEIRASRISCENL
ncbi:MAG: FAD-binding protein [Rhodobacteraceae bacterium]|nr:FAD-binding protein [Paracoccaceae bacterium]